MRLPAGTIFVPLVSGVVVNGSEFPPRDSDIPLLFEHCFNMYDPAVVANLTPTVLSFYPAQQPNVTNWERASDMITHALFTCSARRTAKALSAYVPVYL